MKYFSMFSGIGGFELGIQRAMDNRQKANNQRGSSPSLQNGSTNNERNNVERPVSCVGYSEIDKYAIKVYERNFNGHTNYGNATTINAKELPDFDLLVGGFPCQAFSIAGKRKGFDDTRGTLFFDIARILAEKKPKHLVLENVKGLLSHEQGRTFQTIIGVLADLGYGVEWQVLNSKDFGVPQNRERVIIVGHLGNECTGQVFPISGNYEQTAELQRQQAVTNTLTTRYTATGSGAYVTERELNAQEVRSAATRTRAYAGKPETLEIRKDEISNTINSVTKDYYATDMARIRRLTPIECERLQGFPDDWTKYGVGDELISDTQRYKMCGNAVTTNVIQAVMERLANHEVL